MLLVMLFFFFFFTYFSSYNLPNARGVSFFYAVQADLNVPGSQGDGPPPVGLAAPNTPGTDGGVQLMGGGMVAPEGLGDLPKEQEESSQRETDDHKVLMEVRMVDEWRGMCV